jgi:hypothetical protein
MAVGVVGALFLSLLLILVMVLWCAEAQSGAWNWVEVMQC